MEANPKRRKRAVILDDSGFTLRCDIAKGLIRTPPDAVVLNPSVDAPPFAIAFELVEPTTIPRLLLDGVWAIANINTCLEKGEGGAYIAGVPGLDVTVNGSVLSKSMIRRVMPDGSLKLEREIELQIRIQEVSALVREKRSRGAEGSQTEEASVEDGRGRPRRLKERFVLLVAKSPLAFSLRKAAFITTRIVGRLTAADARGVDERRKVWAQLAMHVRRPIPPFISSQKLVQMFETNTDWMQSSDAHGFTCLFSLQRAIDWMKCRFVAKHEQRFEFMSGLKVHGVANRLALPRWVGGGGEEEDDSEYEVYMVTPRFVEECRDYDADVDREIIRTSKLIFGGGGGSGGNGRGRGRGGGGGGRGRGRGAPRGRGRGGGANGSAPAEHNGNAAGEESDASANDDAGARGESVEEAKIVPYESVMLTNEESEEEEDDGGGDEGMGYSPSSPSVSSVGSLAARSPSCPASSVGIPDEEDNHAEQANPRKRKSAGTVSLLPQTEGSEARRGVLLGGGIPRSLVVMQVILRPSVETQVRVGELRQHMRIFPESVMLELLQGQLQLPEDLLEQMDQQMRHRAPKLDSLETRDVVIGDGQYDLGRSMLSWGDNRWGKQMMETLKEMSGDAAERMRTAGRFMRIGFALSYTRAKGSDSYVNGRVAAYGRYIAFDDGNVSRTECQEGYVRFRESCSKEDEEHNAQSVDEEAEEDEERAEGGGGARGNVTTAAMQYALNVIMQCDRCKWNLRPDNLHLMMQLMISDVMLCLNYHGSVIEGASNGIGATLVIRDGGGNFRQWYKDVGSGVLMMGQVMSKGNGSGADHCVGAYKNIVSIGHYDERFAMAREFITEMKRVTEVSLIQETCNTIEWRGSSPVLRHVIEETDGRKYSTELKAGGDQQSLSNMQAISWLIPRNTVSMENNHFGTTREDGETKERIRVEYRQVIGGYWVICTNVVRDAARERLHTLLAVTRTVGSSAASAGPEDVVMGTESTGSFVEILNREQKENGRDGHMDNTVASSKETELFKTARPVFLAGMATVVFAGFMQWTGMLDKVRETRVSEAIITTFYAQLNLCQDLLNPDMANSGNKLRYLQVSKARGVAVGLLGIGMRETLESGRRAERQQAAVERTALGFKAEGNASAVAWTVADTLEHMCRLDFFIVMGLLAKLFKVPYVPLHELLAWLDTGGADACPKAEAFFRKHADSQAARLSADQRRKNLMDGIGFLQAPIQNGEQGGGCSMVSTEHCLYITSRDLRIPVRAPCGTAEASKTFCEIVSRRLRLVFKDTLKNYCRIGNNEEGDEIMRAMLTCLMDRPFAWPSILGGESTLADFWKGRRPPMPSVSMLRNNPSLLQDRVRLTLPPLRMIPVETTVAQLGADLRWLMLVRSLTENQISLSSRFAVVAQLTQRFFLHCVPNELTMCRELFVALPAPTTGNGFLWPRVLPSKRKLLRRPGRSVGMDAPCRTGMVEDMGVATPRYEMAKMLDVDERDLPTECVHYDLPHGIWMPALIGEEENVPGAVLWKDGRIYMWGEGLSEKQDITLEFINEELGAVENVYLSGRVTQKVRPTAAFYRPGIVVAERADAASGGGGLLGVVGPFDPRDGRYAIQWRNNSLPLSGRGAPAARLTPYEVQERILLPDAELCCSVDFVQEAQVEMQRPDGTLAMFGQAQRGDMPGNYGGSSFICFLDYQGAASTTSSMGEQLAEGEICVRMPRLPVRSRGRRAQRQTGETQNEEENADAREDEARADHNNAESDQAGHQDDAVVEMALESEREEEDDDEGEEDTRKRYAFLLNTSHGMQTLREYEERFAPRIRVHIDGVRPRASRNDDEDRREAESAGRDDEEERVERELFFTKCRIVH